VTLRALDLLEAAKALGLTVPDKLLATADEVTRLSRIAIFGIPVRSSVIRTGTASGPAPFPLSPKLNDKAELEEPTARKAKVKVRPASKAGRQNKSMAIRDHFNVSHDRNCST
jgi:hypothetical protein